MRAIVIGNTRLAPEEIDPRVQRWRERAMAAFDGLPPPIRKALSEAPFDLHVLRPGSQIIIDNMVRRIQAVRTADQAFEFNLDFAGRI